MLKSGVFDLKRYPQSIWKGLNYHIYLQCFCSLNPQHTFRDKQKSELNSFHIEWIRKDSEGTVVNRWWKLGIMSAISLNQFPIWKFYFFLLLIILIKRSLYSLTACPTLTRQWTLSSTRSYLTTSRRASSKPAGTKT